MSWGGSFVAPIIPTRASRSQVAQSASAVPALTANANRQGTIIKNASSATMYVIFGTGGSPTDYTDEAAVGEVWTSSLPYGGPINLAWSASGGGTAYITELL